MSGAKSLFECFKSSSIKKDTSGVNKENEGATSVRANIAASLNAVANEKLNKTTGTTTPAEHFSTLDYSEKIKNLNIIQ